MLALGKRVGNVVRLAEVVQVLVKHGFVNLVRRAQLHEGTPAKLLRGMHILDTPSGDPETQGKRLCAALTELGPTFVKFGQILSTRPDLVGNALSESLQDLQDRVTATPFEAIEAVIVEALGKRPDALFASFEREPVAAASLSQVHRATLKGRTDGGAQVAVKIQRPGIERVIESDLSLMRRIAEWVAAHVEEIAWMDPVGVVDEFTRSITRELDFTIEGRVIEQFRANFEDVPEIFVPRVYQDLSAKRVLTMEWVDGVRIDAIEAYPARHCEPKIVANVCCEMLCRQVFDHHLFHDDPHPGNIFVTHDNQIAFLDYGMVGRVEHTDGIAFAELLLSIFRQDAEAYVNAMLPLTLTGDCENRPRLLHEIADYLAFEARAVISGGNVGEGIKRMVDILRDNRLQLAPRFSLLLKALATVESVGHVLDPKMDMVPVIQPHVERLLAQRYSPSRMMHDAESGIAALIRLARELPADLKDLMAMLRRGQFRTQVRHEGLEPLVGAMDRGSNRVAFGVITGALIVGSSLLMRAGAGVSHLGLAGYLGAGFLGLALVVSILRSRNY
ncbi:MAG: AarF/ABC1/UbiB kinase family protein [Candidatus Hydrogenedentes bacterium]|nr:AarF/ABC1/UbiB kinase family protein [Candidatus Hydrogenedentota bacterium]